MWETAKGFDRLRYNSLPLCSTQTHVSRSDSGTVSLVLFRAYAVWEVLLSGCAGLNTGYNGRQLSWLSGWNCPLLQRKHPNRANSPPIAYANRTSLRAADCSRAQVEPVLGGVEVFSCNNGNKRGVTHNDGRPFLVQVCRCKQKSLN